MESLIKWFFTLLVGATGLLFLIIILALIVVFYLQWKQNQKFNKLSVDLKKLLDDLKKSLEQKIKEASNEEEIKKLRKEFDNLKKDSESTITAQRQWVQDKIEGQRMQYENYVQQIGKFTETLVSAKDGIAQEIKGFVRMLAEAILGKMNKPEDGKENSGNTTDNKK